MSKHDDGGPAFPGPVQTLRDVDGNTIQYAPEGMSLLDWYAGQAPVTLSDAANVLMAELSDEEWENATTDELIDAVVDFKYRIADAMIAEKRRREEAGE